MPNYNEWPCREFARQFYKEIAIGSARYLVPCGKLGQGQIDKAENARRDAAKVILTDAALLASIRAKQKAELETQIAAAKGYMEGASDEIKSGDRMSTKDRFARILVQLNARTLLPVDPEPSDEDADYYTNENRLSEPLHSAWTAALYIPFAGSPSIEEIYEFIPVYVLVETQGFFVESSNAPEEALSVTPVSSISGNG